MNTNQKVVAVYGSSAVKQDSLEAMNAETIGRMLAEAGYAVCTGGYMGVMEAASRGAKAAGGNVIGVTCKDFKDRTPNPYLTQEIETENLPERISTLMHIADGYIVLDGGIGTLAELLLAWNLITMGGSKPLIVVGEPLKKSVYAMKQYTEISDRLLDMLVFVDTVEVACEVMKMKLPLD